MSYERLDELLHRQRKSLGLPKAMPRTFYDGILNTYPIVQPRYIDMAYSQVDAPIVISAPPGYAWRILDLECVYSADVNVADRTVQVAKILSSSGGLAIGYFQKTVTASQTRYLALGPQAPSADAYPNHSYCRVQPWIFGDVVMRFYASAGGEAGDALSTRGVAMEVLSIEP